MFGYVTPLKGELKIKDFAKFRSYYCGVCIGIKKRYGELPRLMLNYDMAFLSLLIDSLSKEDLIAVSERCIAHPIEKKPILINNSAINYAADMNFVLYYYKVKDDILDDNDIKSKFIELSLRPYFKKTSSEINFISNIIKEDLKVLSDFEKNLNFNSIDEISHPFSDIVGNILKLYPYRLENDSLDLREDLYNLGYTLGKWIYLIDALDDLEKDIKEKKFNPLNHIFNKENLSFEELFPLIRERIEFTLLNCSYNCLNIFNLLPIKRNNEIIKNVLELGMMDKYLSVTNKTSDNKGEMK